MKNIFYVLANPLYCLFYARDLVRSLGDFKVHVVLPKYIDPSRFEALLLKDAEYFSGVTVQSISALPRNLLAANGYFDLPKRVDQIELSEHFNNLMPRSLVRPLLNAVLELKYADFEYDYLKSLLEKRKDKEGAILLDIFNKYQDFLQQKNVIDDADNKKIFVDQVLAVGSTIISDKSIFIFAGFNEFSSCDLDIIKTVSSRASKTYVVGPDIFDPQIEYTKLLSEQFTSMGFSTMQVTDNRVEPAKVHEFNNMNDEAYYVSKAVGSGTIYAVTDVDGYYSLLRYHQGADKVSINASMRLDRSCYLRMFATLLLLDQRGWVYQDVIQLLHFTPFWKNNDEILKFASTASKMTILPRGRAAWQQLAREQNNKEVLALFDTALPLDHKKIFSKFFNNIQDLELESVKNLVARVVDCLETKAISAELFVAKLYNHAEENYVLKGAMELKPLNVTLASLAAGNISEKVWFVGMNQDSLSSSASEDIVMNDNFILAFRSADGFLLPTSRESAAISSKIIQAASQKANISYVLNIGAVADAFKEIAPVKHKKQETNILEGAISELKPQDVELKAHKFKRLSASLIEAYMECPYICFAQNIIKAQKRTPCELSLDPRDAGNILHKSLELLLPRTLAGESLDIQEELGVILDTEFKVLGSHPLKGVFIIYYASILENILNQEFEFMRKANLKIFNRPETDFEVDLGFTDGVKIKGKIDRIDVDAAGKKLHVVDYKTSQIPTGKAIESGEDVQLAIYIMAMASLYPEFEYDGHYVSIKGLKRSQLGLLSLEKAKELFAIHGLDAVKGLKAGAYPPKPIDSSICESCYYRRCCGTV